MQKVKSNLIETKKNPAETTRREEVLSRLKFAASEGADALLGRLEASIAGLSRDRVDASREQYGDNIVTHGKKVSLPRRIAVSFVNPFTAILFGLAAVSAFTDILLAEPGEADPITVIIIMTMVLVSGLLRFVQETRSGNAAENLLKMIKTTTGVKRMETGREEIPLEDVVVGDIVYLAAGDMIPADLRILQAKDLFVSQSALTGESIAVEKIPDAAGDDAGALTERPNLAFMGSNVISGSAAGVVVTVGDDTIFGEMARASAKSLFRPPLKRASIRFRGCSSASCW